MKEFLFVAQNLPPANVSGTVRPFYFAKYLAENGWKPHVLACRPNKNLPADHTLLKELEGTCEIHYLSQFDDHRFTVGLRKLHERLRSKNTAVHRGAAFVVRGISRIWKNITHYLTVAHFTLKARQIARHHKIKLVWATGDPWTSFEIGRHIKCFLSIPFVMDQRDPWTYGAMWAPTSELSANRERKKERRALQAADAVVYTSPLTCGIMKSRNPADIAAKMTVICNGYEPDPNEIPPAADESQKQQLTLRYIGSLKGHRTPFPPLQALKSLVESGRVGNDIHLEFVGNSQDWETLTEEYTQKGLATFIGPVPYAESLGMMRTANCLVLLQTLEEGRDVISGKAYEYVASKRPILAVVPEDGGDAWLLRECGAGIIADFRDETAIENAIEEIYKLWQHDRLTTMSLQRLPVQFERRQLTKQLAHLLDDTTRR